MKKCSKFVNNFIYILSIILIFSMFDYIRSTEKIKVFHISNDYYYIIKSNSILYFDSTKDNSTGVYTFEEGEIISTSDEWEKISFGKFKPDPPYTLANLLIAKNTIYAMLDKTYCCNYQLSNVNGYLEISPYRCFPESYCYFTIGFVNSANTLYLYLYRNRAGYCNSNAVSSFTVNGVYSDNISCKFMVSPLIR